MGCEATNVVPGRHCHGNAVGANLVFARIARITRIACIARIARIARIACIACRGAMR
jgi:hypothetical protein